MHDIAEKAACFLHFGFIPKIPSDFLSEAFPYNSAEDFKPSWQHSNNELLQRSKATFESIFQNANSKPQVVPISGGYDSRAILAALLNHVDKENIITVTFGVPGSRDYELGAKVANHFDLQHEAINLSTINVNYEDLFIAAQKGGAWTFLIDKFYNSLIPKMFGKNATYWCGFMGGPMAGAHLKSMKNTSWEEAKSAFFTSNKFSKNMETIQKSKIFSNFLPERAFIDKDIICFEDQLNCALRQLGYIKKVVLFDEYDYKCPFLQPEWVTFSLSLPNEIRKGNNVYHKIFSKIYPEAFALPAVQNFGGSINSRKEILKVRKLLTKIRKRTHESTLKGFWSKMNIYHNFNYIDFDDEFRNETSLKRCAIENLNDLHKRDIIPFNIPSIIKTHRQKKQNFGKELMLLTALEISIKSDESY